MRDIGGTSEDGGTTRGGLVALALQAVQHMAARRMDGVGVLQQTLLDRIVELATAPDQRGVPAILDLLRKARLPDEQIADLYLAEAARVFGEAWLDDRMTFSEVTIGVVRLSDVLHQLAERGADAACVSETTPTALIVVPPGEQHTFGALVLCFGLRRRGLCVNLQLAPTLAELSRLVADRNFDVAFVSLGSTERVETCANLVKSLKRLTKGRVLVAVGGPVIETCHDTLAESGADLVTNDVDLVLARLGQERGQVVRHGG